jgi:hypothetical protein
MSFVRDEVTAAEPRMTKYIGVRNYDGWIAFVNVPGGNTVRLNKDEYGLEPAVFGFPVDAAIARNYWIAYWNMGGAENYNRTRNKPNVIPEGEMYHD